MPTHFAMYSVAWVEVCRVETVIWAHANSREKWQCSEWGERTLESIEHRRSISSCSDRGPSINSTTFLLYDEHKNKICRYNTHKCIFIWLRGVHIFGVVLKGAAEVVTWVFFFFSFFFSTLSPHWMNFKIYGMGLHDQLFWDSSSRGQRWPTFSPTSFM